MIGRFIIMRCVIVILIIWRWVCVSWVLVVVLFRILCILVFLVFIIGKEIVI